VSELILLNKPFQVLSQFTDSQGRKTLADYITAPGFRAAGRLDYDSEGLLLLSNDGVLQQRIANPDHKMWKTYHVQVEGLVHEEALSQLSAGVSLKDGPTKPAKAESITAPDVWPRLPPIRQRQNIADSWLALSIREGRNRQVRRMTAAVGLPTLRLIRVRIGEWSLDDLQPGQHTRVTVHMPQTTKSRPHRRNRK
jgi:23S rRNA pseudouridine2457 synthase